MSFLFFHNGRSRRLVFLKIKSRTSTLILLTVAIAYTLTLLAYAYTSQLSSTEGVESGAAAVYMPAEAACLTTCLWLIKH